VKFCNRNLPLGLRAWGNSLPQQAFRIFLQRNAVCCGFSSKPLYDFRVYEEVYRTEYRGLAEARASIGMFLEKVYNQKRLHSALGYLPPAEFERGLLAQPPVEAAARQLSL
jgi:transposase InsO family protein